MKEILMAVENVTTKAHQLNYVLDLKSNTKSSKGIYHFIE